MSYEKYINFLKQYWPRSYHVLNVLCNDDGDAILSDEMHSPTENPQKLKIFALLDELEKISIITPKKNNFDATKSHPYLRTYFNTIDTNDKLAIVCTKGIFAFKKNKIHIYLIDEYIRMAAIQQPR